MSSISRRLVFVAAAAAIIALLAALCYRVALRELRTQVLSALGPDSEVGEIDLTFRAVRIAGLRLKAPRGWPTRDALRAEEITVVPALTSLLTGTVRIARVDVNRAYLAVLRDPAGRTHILPGLRERASNAGGGNAKGAARRAVIVDEVRIAASTLAFFDADVRSPPLELRLTDVDARVTALHLPDLNDKSEVRLSARLPGAAGQPGTLAIGGWTAFGSRDAVLKVTMRDAAAASLEPYLVRKAETGVRRGALDLDLDARVTAARVSAPGALKLRNLELSAQGGIGTFMGLPRDNVLALLREKDGAITIPFTIEGSIEDPRFALDEAFKTRVGVATAVTLGAAARDLARNLEDPAARAQVRDALKSLLNR